MKVLPPREFVRSVRDYCREHELIETGSRIIAGVSGGADSLALLHTLDELAGSMRLEIHVAHLDHGLRRGAGKDARFVRTAAARLGWPCTLQRRDVGRLAKSSGISVEEAGRLARLSFFFRLARKKRAGTVAVAHNRDDQAETVLMRLLRGASASGLSGISPRRRLVDPFARPGSRGRPVWLVRPLLALGRADIEAYLKLKRVKWRRDPSNASRDFTRNRLRHDLLPLLERRYNPGIRALLARAAQVLEEDDLFLESLADRILNEMPGGGRRPAVPITLVRRAALPVRRRLLRAACVRAGADPRRLAQSHLDALVRLAGAGSGETHLPGVRAKVRAGTIVFLRGAARRR